MEVSLMELEYEGEVIGYRLGGQWCCAIDIPPSLHQDLLRVSVANSYSKRSPYKFVSNGDSLEEVIGTDSLGFKQTKYTNVVTVNTITKFFTELKKIHKCEFSTKTELWQVFGSKDGNIEKVLLSGDFCNCVLVYQDGDWWFAPGSGLLIVPNSEYLEKKKELDRFLSSEVNQTAGLANSLPDVNCIDRDKYLLDENNLQGCVDWVLKESNSEYGLAYAGDGKFVFVREYRDGEVIDLSEYNEPTSFDKLGYELLDKSLI